MQLKHTLESVRRLTLSYRNFINSLSEEEFIKRPSADAWSYSEIYFHIFDASLLSIRVIENIDAGRDEGGRLSLIGRFILYFGVFPPFIKIKAPKHIINRLKSISKAEALSLIETFETKFIFVGNKTTDICIENRVKHGALGYLNRVDWFRFIEVHLKHHLKQIDRTEKAFLKLK